MLHRRVVERVVPLMSSRDFLFDVDLLVIARRLGFAVREVPTIWIDQADSKLHARRDAVRMTKGAVRLWLHHRVLPVDVEQTSSWQPVRRRRSGTYAPRGSVRPDVALIAPYPPQGVRHGGHSGVASYTANLAHALAGRGWHVSVVADRVEGDPAQFDDGPVEVHRAFDLGASALPAAARAARCARRGGGAPAVGAVPLRRPAVAAGAGARARVAAPGSRRAAGDHDAPDRRAVRDRSGVHPLAPRRRARGRRSTAAWPPCSRRSPGPARVSSCTRSRSAMPSTGAAVIPHGIEARQPVDRRAARRSLGLDERALRRPVLRLPRSVQGSGGRPRRRAAMTTADVEVVVAGGEHPRLVGRDSFGTAAA